MCWGAPMRACTAGGGVGLEPVACPARADRGVDAAMAERDGPWVGEDPMERAEWYGASQEGLYGYGDSLFDTGPVYGNVQVGGSTGSSQSIESEEAGRWEGCATGSSHGFW